jgi:hypothetical protein
MDIVAAIVVILVIGLLSLWFREVLLPWARFTLALTRAAWNTRAAFHPLTRAGAWRLLGVTTVLVSVLCVLFIWKQQRLSTAWLVGPILLLEAFLATFCFARARRFDALAPAISADPRPPVLYLRSFRDDWSVGWHLGMAAFRLTTEEEELADIFRSVGPLVAVADPGDTLPYAGAQRLQIDSMQWRERVASLMSAASLVLIRVGGTSGIWWELEHAVKKLHPERLVLLLPLSKRRYETFQRKAESLFPSALPAYQGRRIPSTTLRSVMVFDADWTPHIWPVQQTQREYWSRAFSGLFANLSFSDQNTFTKPRSDIRVALEATLRPVVMRVSGTQS